MSHAALTDHDTRMRYAMALAKGAPDPLAAALQIGLPHFVALEYLNQGIFAAPDVVAEVERLKNEVGELGLLPTKAELARKIFDTADSAQDIKTKYEGYKLYADVMGFIEKQPSGNVNNGVINNTKVVVVPQAASNIIDWEARAIEQQRKLAANVD